MHNLFYASGFLYNSRSQQILLLQSQDKDDTTPLWSMLSGRNTEEEEAHITFQKLISKLLSLELKHKNIYPIYDYFNSELDSTNFVFYAEVKKSPKFDLFKNGTLHWINFSDTLKLLFTEHTKQDLVVGERVINLKWRIDQNLQQKTIWEDPSKLILIQKP